MERACALDDIPDGGCLGVDLAGKTILLHRRGDRVTALEGICPHEGAPLAEGAAGGGLVVCPFHHAVFALEDGARRHGPGLGDLGLFPARIENGAVMVDPTAPAAAPAPARDGPRIVVLGAGAAGLACVDQLRRLGHHGPITLIDREADPLYERTALSKDVLRGAADPADVARTTAAALDRMGVARRFGVAARAVDAAARRIVLEDGEAVPYDLCFAAPGAEAKRLDLPGADLDGVATLRAAEDALAIRARAAEAGRCAVIGGGFIGMEAAAALALSGVETTLVVREARPGAGPLADDIGDMVADRLRGFGVRLLTGTEPEAFEGEDGRLAGVRLSSGETIETPLALVAVGEALRGDVAGEAEADGAVAVGPGLAAEDGLWIGGDAAARQGARTRHWRAAEEEGRRAAAAMLGRPAPPEPVPFFWTQIGAPGADMVGLHMVGRTDPALPHVDVGSVAENAFTRFHLDGDAVVGATGSGAEDRTAAFHLALLLLGRIGRDALSRVAWEPSALVADGGG